MSQHHMTVTHLSGATLKLVAGFDPRLREFFLELRDARLTPPDERPEELSVEAQAALDLQQADYVNYDSLHDAQTMRSISDVEAVLEEYAVPYGDDEYNPDGLNPELQPLLVVIMNEKENGGPEVGRTVRFWDEEAEEAETEQAVLREEQNTEWAAEARANREAEAASDEQSGSCVCSLPIEHCNFECPEGQQARAEFEQEAGEQQEPLLFPVSPKRTCSSWCVKKAQTAEFWAKHSFPFGPNNCTFRFPTLHELFFSGSRKE